MIHIKMYRYSLQLQTTTWTSLSNGLKTEPKQSQFVPIEATPPQREHPLLAGFWNLGAETRAGSTSCNAQKDVGAFQGETSCHPWKMAQSRPMPTAFYTSENLKQFLFQGYGGEKNTFRPRNYGETTGRHRSCGRHRRTISTRPKRGPPRISNSL